MLEILKKCPDITAIFAMSDVMAIGAIRAITDFGLCVPEHISVIGLDGIEMGQYVVPKLTTIMQPGEEIAKRCVEILLNCICEKLPPVYEQTSFTLVEGESMRNLK